MAVVVVRRHHRTATLERRAVADCAAPDAERPGLELEVVGRDRARPCDEDLLPTRVDHGTGPRRQGRERVQRGDAGAGDLERKSEASRERQSDSRAREAPRARADDDRVELGRCRPRAREQLVDVADQGTRRARALAEHPPVQQEGARRDVCRGVEGEDEH